MTKLSREYIDSWKQNGVIVIENFFDQNEMQTIRGDYERLYGDKGQLTPNLTDFSKQFDIIDVLPYAGSVNLNLISLHPALIAAAKSLLEVESVHLYQSHTWAKFTGSSNYEQKFHCDFGNHTLTVPSTELASSTVNFLIYVSDVTAEHGPFEYVPKSVSDKILGERALLIPQFDNERYEQLQAAAKSVLAPSGSLIIYGLDVFHRGTNLTGAHAARFSMTVSYKRSGNDGINFHSWQHTRTRDWSLIIEHASPEQLSCLGIPLPGSKFWNDTTLAQTCERWPKWDATPYELSIKQNS